MTAKHRHGHRTHPTNAVNAESDRTEAPHTRKHPLVNYANGKIQIVDPLGSADGIREIDARKMLLPATRLASASCIADHPRLLTFTLKALKRALAQRRSAKSTAESMTKRAQLIAKFVEFLYINGIYDPTHCTKRLTQKLLKEFSRGGWQQALQLEERTNSLCTRLGAKALRGLIRTDRNARVIVSEELRTRLSTNCRGPELEIVRSTISNFLGLAKRSVDTDPGEDSVTSTALFQVLDAVNLLAELPEGGGLEFVPFPSPFELAEKFGRPGGRTKNITPSNLGLLLGECFRWVFTYSTPLLAILTELTELIGRVKPSSASQRAKLFASLASTSVHAAEFSHLSSWTIVKIREERNLSKEECTLSNAIDSLMTACFLITMFFNGRRKDEIQHPKIGLASGSLRRFGTSGNLYVCEFYLEKFTKDFRDFFVGEATVAAIQVLEQLLQIETTLAGGKPKGSRQSLFRLATIRAKFPLQHRQYSFTPTRSGKRLLSRVFQDDSEISFATHMGRRGYCLLMMYRYSNPSILALSQQLGHRDVGFTITYVTDPQRGNTVSQLEGFGQLRPPPDSVRRDLDAEMLKVSKDRLVEIVDEIITGSGSSQSGFSKFVTRLHSRLGSSLRYEDRALSAESMVISEYLLNRGHKVTPFRHADCCAPDLRAPSAKCSNGTGVPQRENASPKTCDGCRYQSRAPSHILAMSAGAEHLERLSQSLPIRSTERERLLRDAAELRAASMTSRHG
jgi:hypothetical protein